LDGLKDLKNCGLTLKTFFLDLKDLKILILDEAKFYAAFTLNGFDGQERNLTFVKTDF